MAHQDSGVEVAQVSARLPKGVLLFVLAAVMGSGSTLAINRVTAAPAITQSDVEQAATRASAQAVAQASSATREQFGVALRAEMAVLQTRLDEQGRADAQFRQSVEQRVGRLEDKLDQLLLARPARGR